MGRTRRQEEHFTRQVFPSWTIAMPLTMEETFVHDGEGYWHAYDDRRSISLTSMVLSKGDDPVTAEEIITELPVHRGQQVEQMPPGLIGWAFADDAPDSSRAGRLLSGIVAVDGRVLLVTITCDDEAWSRRVWQSIRYDPVPPASAALARMRQRLGAPVGAR